MGAKNKKTHFKGAKSADCLSYQAICASKR